MLALNTNISNMGDISSAWGTPWSSSNVMPLNQKQGVTKMKSFTNVASSNHKQAVDTNPTVATNTTVGNGGAKSSFWGTPWSSSNAKLQNPSLTGSQSSMHYDKMQGLQWT